MNEGKRERLLGRIRHMAGGGHRSFEPSRALEHFQSTIYTWNAETDHLSWGPNAERILGIPQTMLPVTGQAYAALTEPGCGLGRADAIAADAIISHPRGMPYQLHYALRLDDELIVMVEDRGRWFADDNGHPAFAHGTMNLIGKAEDHLLPIQTRNRSKFLSDLTRHAMTRSQLRQASILVFAIDFPELTPVDGTGFCPGIHDHPHGNEILDEVITRARTLMRRSDSLLLQPDGTVALALMACSSADIDNAVARLHGAIEASPVSTVDGTVTVSIRIGAACAPDHATSATLLLNHAEEALRATSPKQKSAVFDGLNLAYMKMERSLVSYLAATEAFSEQALGEHVVLMRRPLFDAQSRLPALHLAGPGHRGSDLQIAPAHHLRPMAEEAGLSLHLDRHLLDLTCEALAVTPDGIAVLPVSPATLADPEWPVILAAGLGTRPEIASRLIIGMPEILASENPALLERRANAIKALGVGIAITGFGGGFMACDALKHLPVDLVAFDGAVIQNIAAATDNRFYLRGLISVLQQLDIATAAMWVEDERTSSLLSDWGVTYLEGRIKAAPAPEMEQALQRSA